MQEQNWRDRLKVLLLNTLLVLMGYLVYRIFHPFLVPLTWAAILAVAFQPVHCRILKRVRPGMAAFLSMLGVTLILIVPAIFITIAFVNEGIAAARALKNAQDAGNLPVMEKVELYWNHAAKRFPALSEYDPKDLMQTAAEKAGGFLAGKLGSVFKNIAVFFFDLFVLMFALFYLFRDGHGLVEMIRKLLPFEESRRNHMLHQTKELIHASVTSHLLIAATQGFLGGLAFAILGVPSPVFWGVVMAFLSLLPVVGSWLIWLPAAILLMATGHLAKGIILIGIGAGLISLADNFMRPWLLSGSARMNGLIIFVSVIGGLAVFGTLGIVLGPVVVALAYSMMKGYLSTSPQPAGTG